MNGSADNDYFDEEYDERPLALELTDRVLTAMGGSPDTTVDERDATERVARIYLRMLRLVRDEE